MGWPLNRMTKWFAVPARRQAAKNATTAPRGALPGRVHDGEQRAQNAQVHRGVERIHGEQLIVPGTLQKVESYGNR